MSMEQDANARSDSDGHHLTPSSVVATVFFDRELRLTGYTPNAAEICRVLPHAMGQHLSDFRHQLEYPDLHADAERALVDRAAVEREVRSADGRHFLARLLPHFGSGEAVAGVVLTFVEVTALKRAAETCAFLAAIVQSSEDSIISIDFGGKITSWNAAAERLYGYPAREALGKPLTMLTLPEDLAQVLRNVDRIKHSKDVETFDTVRIHKDGRELSLSITLSPVKNHRGEVIGVSTIARDISARRGAEAALVVSEEQFRRAIEDAPIPVIMHAEDGQVLQVSKAWTALTGYTRRRYSHARCLVKPRPRRMGKRGARTDSTAFPRRVAPDRYGIRPDDAHWRSPLVGFQRLDAGDVARRAAIHCRHGARHYRTQERRGGTARESGAHAAHRG